MQTMNSIRTLSTAKSEQVLQRGRQSIAGGDSSTMRVLPYHLPLVAARGEAISCKAGCGACCRQLVPVSETEAHHLRDVVEAMPEPRRAAVTARRLR